jgi:hypothetical protein
MEGGESITNGKVGEKSCMFFFKRCKNQMTAQNRNPIKCNAVMINNVAYFKHYQKY